jgi:hypothetical protein
MPPGSPMQAGPGASELGMQGLGVPSGPPQGHRHGQGAGLPPGPGGQQGALAPLDPQRGLAPQRQIRPANGVPYPPPDRNSPYGGQPPQFGTSLPAQGYTEPPYTEPPYTEAPYTEPPYSGPQQTLQAPQSLPPVAMSIGDAVQSAHAEGFSFGEAVARDAPALWLEAVLARKPRMPSDLEARLLQGSALPIDSLLHDEVRHALRRGFWDALERSRH